MTPEGVDQLEQSCVRFESLRVSNDISELIRENLIFHGIIGETAASPRLSEFVRMATALPLAYKSYYWFSEEQKIVSGHFHKQITTTLTNRDGKRAEGLMREHLLGARDFLALELRRGAHDESDPA